MMGTDLSIILIVFHGGCQKLHELKQTWVAGSLTSTANVFIYSDKSDFTASSSRVVRSRPQKIHSLGSRFRPSTSFPHRSLRLRKSSVETNAAGSSNPACPQQIQIWRVWLVCLWRGSPSLTLSGPVDLCWRNLPHQI
jgi:hypothetical protein